MAAPKAAKAVDTEGQATDTVDPRAAALAALTGGAADPETAVSAEPETLTDEAEDFGGESLAVVLTTRYNAKVDGDFKQTRKGAVIKTTTAAFERGIEIGALRKFGK